MPPPYADWPEKGPAIDGVRLTIMSDGQDVGLGEPVDVHHVVEYLDPGRTLYPMGPKQVLGEHVDGRPATPPATVDGDPLVPLDYDGLMLPGPGVDTNWDVTRYSFDEPGDHRVVWQLGPYRSNVLVVRVSPS